jgi:hypothetical protein
MLVRFAAFLCCDEHLQLLAVAGLLFANMLAAGGVICLRHVCVAKRNEHTSRQACVWHNPSCTKLFLALCLAFKQAIADSAAGSVMLCFV